MFLLEDHGQREPFAPLLLNQTIDGSLKLAHDGRHVRDRSIAYPELARLLIKDFTDHTRSVSMHLSFALAPLRNQTFDEARKLFKSLGFDLLLFLFGFVGERQI